MQNKLTINPTYIPSSRTFLLFPSFAVRTKTKTEDNTTHKQTTFVSSSSAQLHLTTITEHHQNKMAQPVAMKRVGKNPKYQHHAFANRAKPAYPGANFDDEGFCVVHNTVRLCELRDDGRYKILRKLCYKCGNTAIVPKSECSIKL